MKEQSPQPSLLPSRAPTARNALAQVSGQAPKDKAVRAIRSFCRTCQGGAVSYVASCADSACPLHAFRQSRPSPDGEASPTSPPPPALSAARPAVYIRRYCIVCAGGRKEARECTAGRACPLWPYRFGVTPETYRRVMDRLRGPRRLLLPGFIQRAPGKPQGESG